MADRWISDDLHLGASGAIRLVARPSGVNNSACRRQSFAMLLVWLLIGVLTPQAPLSAGQVTQAYAEAEAMSCGPRAVFALARMLGREPKYQSVREEIQLSDKGCSTEDLKNSLTHHGISCSVRRLDITQLFSVPPPFIAHLNFQGARTGHFVIVNRVGVEGLETFDPLVNRDKFWKWRSFSDWWSGYVIVPSPSPTLRGIGPAMILLGLHVFTLAVLLVSIGRSPRPWSRHARRATQVATTILILVTSDTFAAHSAEADEIIRSNLNEGVNAASLLGGICGVKITPTQTIGGDACDTLAEVQSLLSSLGITTSVRRVNYGDLMDRTGPCIVTLRPGKNDVGTFHVVLKADPDSVTSVDAGPLTVQIFPVDEFRRRWTGHALIPNRGGSRIAYLTSVGALILPALAYAIGRRGNTRPKRYWPKPRRGLARTPRGRDDEQPGGADAAAIVDNAEAGERLAGPQGPDRAAADAVADRDRPT